MAKAKQGKLTHTQIKAWVDAKSMEFKNLLASLHDAYMDDYNAYNGSQVDAWLHGNLTRAAYDNETVRHKLAKLMLELGEEELRDVFRISTRNSNATSWREDDERRVAYTTDLKLALTMAPFMDSYESTTQAVTDMHVLKYKQRLGA